MDNQRLDVFVAEKFNVTRQKAQSYIKEGCVMVNGKAVIKPGYIIKENDSVSLIKLKFDFVSRGGYKLLKAIEDFGLNLKDKICLDIGASTGGFTHCMLCFGAERIYAIDVGFGQLSPLLLEDERVINIENMNVKDLGSSGIPIEKADFISVDVSFISLSKTIPSVKNFLKEDGIMVCLIKPQFEIGPAKNNSLKDKKTHRIVIEALFKFFEEEKLYIHNFTYSPIKGQSGNIEYLVALGKHLPDRTIYFNIGNIINSAFESLKSK